MRNCENGTVEKTNFYFLLFLSYKLVIFVLEKYSRIDWIGKLINFNEIPRQASLLNGGPRPSG
ncbi:hypothetical protein DXC10_14070 [Bacteroides sp. OM08-11]|nr:hypothetical protein DXC10_14070 [Bacteroides sp. OM08-11]